MRIALLAIVLAACTSHDEHHIEASWTVDKYTPFLQGNSIGCPDGWDLARLVAIDPAHPDVRSVDTFPCDAFQGESSYLPADSYIAWIELTTADGSKVLAQSLEETVEVTSFNPILLTDIYVDAGYAEIEWELADPARCPDDGSLGIRLDLAPTSEAFVSEYVSCSAPRLVSPALLPGSYTATFSNHDQVVSVIDHVTIEAPNRVTRLGTVTIP